MRKSHYSDEQIVGIVRESLCANKNLDTIRSVN